MCTHNDTDKHRQRRTDTHKYICIHTHTHTHTCAHTYTDTHKRTYTCMHTQTHTIILCGHTYTRLNSHPHLHTCTYTHNTYMHLRIRGCYITDGTCLVYFFWITWATAYKPSVISAEWSPTNCSTFTCSRGIRYINYWSGKDTLGKHTHTHSYTHNSYLHLRTRGCYITNGICLVSIFFLWITWPTAHGCLLSLLNGRSNCCSRSCYINRKVH